MAHAQGHTPSQLVVDTVGFIGRDTRMVLLPIVLLARELLLVTVRLRHFLPPASLALWQRAHDIVLRTLSRNLPIVVIV